MKGREREREREDVSKGKNPRPAADLEKVSEGSPKSKRGTRKSVAIGIIYVCGEVSVGTV